MKTTKDIINDIYISTKIGNFLNSLIDENSDDETLGVLLAKINANFEEKKNPGYYIKDVHCTLYI